MNKSVCKNITKLLKIGFSIIFDLYTFENDILTDLLENISVNVFIILRKIPTK